MGFSRQEDWSRLQCPPPGALPDPGMEPMSLMSPPLASGFFTTTAAWEAHHCSFSSVQFSSIQSPSHVRLFATSRTAACQASLSITNSWNLLKLMSIELVMPSNHLILCRPLLLLPSIFSSIRVFSKGSVLHIR